MEIIGWIIALSVYITAWFFLRAYYAQQQHDETIKKIEDCCEDLKRQLKDLRHGIK